MCEKKPEFFSVLLKNVPVSGTSGGIFAMRKDWFQQLGLFDEGMREWGGGLIKLHVQRYAMCGRQKIDKGDYQDIRIVYDFT